MVENIESRHVSIINKCCFTSSSFFKNNGITEVNVANSIIHPFELDISLIVKGRIIKFPLNIERFINDAPINNEFYRQEYITFVRAHIENVVKFIMGGCEVL